MQIDEQIKQMQHLMYYKGAEAPVKRQTSLEYMREGVDGKTYGISHEGNSYYIKVSEKAGKNLVAEDFDYVGGFVNKGRVKYASYTDAMKNLDMKLQEIRTSLGKKATIIESTNPEYKEVLITEATGEMSDFIKRQRQIMANMRVIEEGANLQTKPVGLEIGKVGDSEPFGEQHAEANQFAEKSGFEEKPKEANADGEPAGAKTPGVGNGPEAANDGLKEVPGAKEGAKAAEKPVMKEEKDFDEEETTPAKEADETPCEKCGKTPCECGKEDGADDKLQQILDRLDALEKKIEEIPFQEEEPATPVDPEGEPEAGLDLTPAEDEVPVDPECQLPIDATTEPQIEEEGLGIEWEDENPNGDPDEQEQIDALWKKYPWLKDTDAELAAIEHGSDAAAAQAAAEADINAATAAEEEARRAEEEAAGE